MINLLSKLLAINFLWIDKTIIRLIVAALLVRQSLLILLTFHTEGWSVIE